MNSSYFFLQADRKESHEDFFSTLKQYAENKKQQIYIIDKPLSDNKYSYEYKDAVVLLNPKHKILFINFDSSKKIDFNTYYEDFLEDIGSLSDKFRYKEIIGRPRDWKNITFKVFLDENNDIDKLLNDNYLSTPEEQKYCELLISLLTGSINDIKQVKKEVPIELLDKIKQKIILFDGDQTRFLYEKVDKKRVVIQGLSGTGKTELLLHKLKELYTQDDNSKIAFTCHNKVLASEIKRRIPVFFNFMKVEQQIDWNKRLWCIHAWGSQSNKDSGVYSYICENYNIQFLRYGWSVDFNSACSSAIEQIKQKKDTEKNFKYAFDFILIDESQDFPESFFKLCEMVSEHSIYIAGDIFQNIFEDAIHNITPDYLLNKCYRTDPRTLMFAHALSLGLFENPKLGWLEDDDWKKCGYIVHKENNTYKLTREPLRRFEDLQYSKSMDVFCSSNIVNKVIKIIEDIKMENSTVKPEDFSIIFLDNNKNIYQLSDELEQIIPRKFNWEVNKAYETKQKINNKVFISNRNNVKGLEFPFVICVTREILDDYKYRNTLYTMLTRSFIKSYLLISVDTKKIINQLRDSLLIIEKGGFIEVSEPSSSEKEAIKNNIVKIKSNTGRQSHYDFITGILDDLNVQKNFRDKLRTIVIETVGEIFDDKKVREVIDFNYNNMLKR
jgi:superfamily I DNA and RNA helicase